MMTSISFPLAFLAGLLSFVSPCVLPLVPVYLGYLSGSSIYSDAPPSPWYVLSRALLFVAGLTFVFVILFGLPTTLLSGALQEYSGWINKIGGAILVLFGLHTMGVVTVPILNMTRQLEVKGGAEPGYARSALFGVTFAAGWTSCIGPLLGTVMTLAFTEPTRTAAFTLVHALGLESVMHFDP